MPPSFKDILWNQFGASIDMLANVVQHCPEGYFDTHRRFYYIAYHSAVFLDYYLTLPPSGFEPLLSFTQKERAEWPPEAIDDLVPDRIYSPKELGDYINNSREKCRKLIASLDETGSLQRFTEGDGPQDMDYPVVEILLYNMRHTQHHAAQLNLLFRQDRDKHMEWSFRAGDIEIL